MKWVKYTAGAALMLFTWSCTPRADAQGGGVQPQRSSPVHLHMRARTPHQPSLSGESVHKKREVEPKEALLTPTLKEAQKLYPWPRAWKGYESLAVRYPVPKGATRIQLKRGSWSWWVRHLPMRPKGTVPKDYKGNIIKDYAVYTSGVVDLDVGRSGLQQCIDTVIRLRAEYLWGSGRAGEVGFRFSGKRRFFWRQYKRGIRPVRKAGRVRFEKRNSGGYSKRYFYAYLRWIYRNTGTVHHWGKTQVSASRVMPGDYFVTVHERPVMGGAGHAVMVVDLARTKQGRVLALLGEGDIPAQDFHIMRTESGTDWFALPAAHAKGAFLWPTQFTWKDLKGFTGSGVVRTQRK